MGHKTFKKGAKQILKEMVQDVLFVGLSLRLPPRHYEITKGLPTISIVARWNEGCAAIWERAVARIKRFVDSKRIASNSLDQIDIGVEMIDEKLIYRDRSDPALF